MELMEEMRCAKKALACETGRQASRQVSGGQRCAGGDGMGASAQEPKPRPYHGAAA